MMLDVKKEFKGNCADLLLRRPVSGLKVRSAESKDCLQTQPVTPRRRIFVHTQKTFSVKKASCPRGKLTDTATGIAVDDSQLIKWARTNWQTKKKVRFVSFEVEALSKLQEANVMHDLLQPTEITKRRSPPE